MKTVIIEYATISPAILANRICKQCHCLAMYRDLNEDCFELTVYGFCYPSEIAKAENILAEYV